MPWENVYETRTAEQISWTQDIPKTSLDFFHSFHFPKESAIIDVGQSKLVDYLLKEGYQNITVLDISAKALEKSKSRLGERANLIKWVISDILDFVPDQSFDFWHDRATFHFLTRQVEIKQYPSIARKSIQGYLAIETFSKQGPTKCSGLDVQQYSEETLTAELENGFQKIRYITEDHITPFQTSQNFLFCSFRRQSKSPY